MRRSTPNPALDRLEALVGEWELEASVGGQTIRGARTTFEWVEGSAFLVQHTDAEPDESAPSEWVANAPFPIVTIIGLDDSAETFSMLYADGRGVLRVYEMTLGGGVWKIWRNAPGFFQRFTATFSDDRKTITGSWEGSRDGSKWEHDFGLTYRKVA